MSMAQILFALSNVFDFGIKSEINGPEILNRKNQIRNRLGCGSLWFFPHAYGITQDINRR